MSTATVHVHTVPGFPGPARCFRLDPPYQGHDYVTVWAQPRFSRYQPPEVLVVPATETGVPVEPSIIRRPGSYVLHEGANTTQDFDWYCWLSLQMLGRPAYELVAS